jgi:hypothetical protein
VREPARSLSKTPCDLAIGAALSVSADGRGENGGVDAVQEFRPREGQLPPWIRHPTEVQIHRAVGDGGDNAIVRIAL